MRSDRANATISYDVKVTDTTANNLLVPVRLILDPSQYFQGAPIGAGFSGGLWVVDLSAGVLNGVLQPGQSTTARTITIQNPFAQRADFGHGIYGISCGAMA